MSRQNKRNPQLSRRALRNAMKSSGMSRQEIAEKVGVSQSALSNYLYDQRRPSPQILNKLAEVLGKTAADLLRGESK